MVLETPVPQPSHTTAHHTEGRGCYSWTTRRLHCSRRAGSL